MVFYPEDGQRFMEAMDLLRHTALDRVREPERRLGITVIFNDRAQRAVDTYSVRIHPDGKTFCWAGEHGEYREPLSQVQEVIVWRL